MPLEDKALLYDIREACLLVLAFTRDKDYEAYAADPALRSAVERQFITIGEALNRLVKLNPEYTARIPQSRAIISFRNILVHGYDRVEDEVVWGIVKQHTCSLQKTVESLMAAL